jgi:hypothetical protein
MNLFTRTTTLALLLLISAVLTPLTVAQQIRQTPKPLPKVVPAPPPTFDTLIPADTYTVYGEVRGVGQLIRSSAMNDILEPILNLAAPPKEFKALVKWLNAHADEVMTSRMLIATWPAGKDVPGVVIAIEFASAEEATKFAGPLNEFLPKVIPASPVEPPETAGEAMTQTKDSKPAAVEKTKAAPALKPNYYLQQAGSLVLITPTPLKLKQLKPAGSRPLSEDGNFRAARNRFNSEPVFAFIDVKAIERQEEERRKHSEEEARAEGERREKEKAAAPAEEEAKKNEEDVALLPEEVEEAEELAKLKASASPEPPKEEPPPPDPVSTALSMLASSFFGLESKWPEGVGLALNLDNDSFDLRGLLVNQPGEKSDAVPFMPMLIPGPAFVPESPNILPADSELLVTMSLDLPQIYSVMSKPRPNTTFYTSSGNVKTVHEEANESPFAAIEKRLGISLKDDLLPLLGSEIALRLPVKDFGIMGLPIPGNQVPAKDAASAKAGPVLAISLKDKEAVRALMPKLIDSLGFKGASSLAQSERRDDTEIVSYAGFFSYAFVGNFLVLSGDPATTRHVVDSYLKRETLSGDAQFRSSTRWQPRPMHGQVYVSPALMESYKTWAEKASTSVGDQTRAFLTRLAATAQPITYSLSNEGFGPLHELRVPRNLVLMAVAGISSETNPPPTLINERNAMGALYALFQAERRYKEEKGNGSYATFEQLVAEGMASKEMLEGFGYKVDLTVSGDKFEVSAAPLEYGKTGLMSYFIDQTGVLRGVDRSGASATSSDPPVN